MDDLWTPSAYPGAMSRNLLVGVDVGGSKIAALVAAPGGPALGRAEQPTDVTTPERTLDGIVAAVEQALRAAGAGPADLAAVGLGIPGRVRPERGLVESAVNLRWRCLAAGEILSARLGVPCYLENDARAAALGAHALPGERHFRHWAYLSVGTGLAGGLILDGRLYRGPNGMAGEIGHIVVEPGGEHCACGLDGCLETLVAGPAIARQARAESARAVYAAAVNGDGIALAVTRRAGAYLARAVHGLVMTCDLERVVFGGGVARAGAAFLDPICDELERLRRASTLAAEVLRPGLVALAPPEAEVALWGALAVASDYHRDH
jgi:glucokinase